MSLRPSSHTIDVSAPEHIRRLLAGLESAAIRHRRDVRRQLCVGEEELSTLLFLDQHGQVAQHEVARVASLSRTGAGVMLQRLEERGYVRRCTKPTDRRVRFVELSSAGREHLDYAYRDFGGLLQRVLRQDPNRGAALAQWLDNLATVGANKVDVGKSTD
jgi:DNA-binding MarR family transcriptional regulator